MTEKAILFDALKCMGCRGCQVACKEWNDLKAEKTTNRGTVENPPDLSADTWLKIKFNEIGTYPDVRWTFGRRSCMHCREAACVDVCPTKALYHHELGFVAYEKSKCSGCGYCVAACPFEVPRTSGTLIGIRHSNKCVMCQDRITNGDIPACVKSCPPGALSFGDRSQLLETAKARVSAIKAKHPKANLYGEKELGGLHVLYVLEDDPTSVYGLPDNPRIPVSATVWQDVVRPIGWTLAGLAVLGLGLNYVIAKRKIELHSKGESHGK